VTKRVAVFVLLLLVAACSSNSSPKTTAGPTMAPVAAGHANRPHAGKYVYSLTGAQGTRVPAGTAITETISSSGDTYTSKITNNQNPNFTVLERKWSSSGVTLDRTETHLQGRPVTTCSFAPPLRVIPIPIKTGALPNQNWGTAGCSGVTLITVDGQQQIQDGTGRSWTVWKIEEKTQTPTMDIQTHYFSPQLGVDIRDERSAPSSTVILLTSYPR